MLSIYPLKIYIGMIKIGEKLNFQIIYESTKKKLNDSWW